MVFNRPDAVFTVRHSHCTGTGGVCSQGYDIIRGNLRVGQALEKWPPRVTAGRWLMIYWQGKEIREMKRILPLILALVAGMAQLTATVITGPVLILLTRSKGRKQQYSGL